jgi:hypothetical protein
MISPSAVGLVAENDNAGPSAREREWLRRGIGQPGGKLPLFDDEGQQVSAELVRGCIDKGWAEPWFSNPLKPAWLVCKLTRAGRIAAALH